MQQIQPKIVPVLDRGFVPAVLWNRAYEETVHAADRTVEVVLALTRPDGSCFRHETRIRPPEPENEADTLKYLERIVKFLLWQHGASRVYISGCDALAARLGAIYSADGARAFDSDFFGRKVFGETLRIEPCRPDDLPSAQESALPLGGHLDGCRIGFDLGGSDRKCAAVVDGEVVFSEEVAWNPYFEQDPRYHIDGVQDSLLRAAAHLPRVDAIGGSAAGIYVNSEVRAGSLFRGVGEDDFEEFIRPMFRALQEKWGGVPFEVVNDGDVTALAGSMACADGALLGVAMGTSEATGYCDPNGSITTWMNELAFAPVDYAEHAPVDEWSGDSGCGVQYFSQQGVARLAQKAGLSFPEDVPFAERLVLIQERMKAGEETARRIFESIGTCFGYALAHYADFYELRHVLVLGRVTTGEGGEMILSQARTVLEEEFPELHTRMNISMPDETMKRHGQAVAAASLPARTGNV